jgi:hypothetical protein
MTSPKSISARIAKAARPRERSVRDDLDDRVKAYGGETRAMTYLGRAGCPDVLAVFPLCGREWTEPNARPGTSVWIETKQTQGRLTQHQKDEHALLRAAGQTVLVVVTRADLDDWLPPL